MIKTLTLTSLILLLLATKTFAQRPVQGFVITAPGDTIRGELFQSERDARKQTIHIKPAGQQTVTYTAATLQGIGRLNLPLIESKTYGKANTPILAETLIKGPVSLYKGYEAAPQDVRYSPDIRYYLQFPDSAHLTLVTQASLVQSLGACLSPEGVQQITAKRKKYNTAFLKQTVNAYSTCRYATTPVEVEAPYRGWYTSWGAKAGINSTRLTTPEGFINLSDAKSGPSSNWQAGVFGTLANWNGFAVQGELIVVQMQGIFSQNIYSGTTLYTINRQAEFKFQQLRVPVLLRYQAGHGLLRPFVIAGPYLSYELSHTTSIKDKRSDQETITDRAILWPHRQALGLQGGAGLYFDLPNLPGISLETTYSTGQQGLRRADNFTYKDVAFSLAVYL